MNGRQVLKGLTGCRCDMAGKDKQRTKGLEWVCIQRSCTVRDFMAGRRGRCRKTVQ